MLVLSYSAAALAILFVCAAVFLLLQRSKTVLQNVYILFLLTAALWMGANAIADFAMTHALIRGASGLAMIGGALSTSAILYFTYIFLYKEYPRTSLQIVYLAPAVFFSLFAFSTFSIVDTNPVVGAPSETTLGRLYVPYGLWLLATLIYTVSKLTKNFITTTGREQQKTLYVLLGFGTLLLAGIVFNIVLPALDILTFFSLGPQFALLFALATGYAIFKHDLFDARVIVQRSLIYSVLFSLLILLYSSILALGRLFVEASLTYFDFITYLIVTIIALYTAPSIDRWLRRHTNPIFFKDTYDYPEALLQLTKTSQESLDMSSLLERSESGLAQTLQAKFIKIVRSDTADQSDILRIPVRLKQEQVGIILVGPKKSGDSYSETDMKFLRTFARQTALAIGRVLLYQEVVQRAAGLEDKVQQRTQELQTAQEAQRAMMLQISHNLQTPLAVLQTKLESSLKDKKFSGTAIGLQRSIVELSGFINDLLYYARLDSGHDKLKMATCDISDLLNGLVEELSVIADAEGIELSANITPNLRTIADTQRLREAVMNLASNAFKYIGNIGDKQVRIAATATGTTITITITDTGIGMTAEEVDQIFNHFYQVKHTKQGAGLGLAIAKQIVEKHDGTISVTSLPNVGSTFTITLPSRS